MAGITPTGFDVKTQETILAELVAEERAEIDAGVDVSSSSILGQLNGILSNNKAEEWEVLQAIHNSFGLRANGQQLRSNVQLFGVYAGLGTKSKVTLSVTLASGFTLPAGSIASVLGNGNATFVTTVSVNNPSAGPAAFDVICEAPYFGPTPGYAGTITVIVSPSSSPSGWISCTNPLDATLGSFAEGDVELRARQQSERAAGRGSNIDAIYTKLLDVPDVISAKVLENVNAFTDANGTPPHSVQCVIYDGPSHPADINAIAQAIWDSKSAGIRASGPFTGNAIDKQGDTQAMGYDYAATKALYIHVSLEVDSGVYSSTGDDLVKQAIVDYTDANISAPKKPLVLSRLYPEIFAVPGVTRIANIWQSEFADPQNTGFTTDYDTGLLEVVDLDTSRITVSLA